MTNNNEEDEDEGEDYEDEDCYVYVIGFANGIVKVGRSRNIRQRYRSHRSWARTHGTSIAEVDVSLRYGTAAPDERRLIRFCRDRWENLPGYAEHFVDADYEEVWTYFRALEHMAAASGWLSEIPAA